MGNEAPQQVVPHQQLQTPLFGEQGIAHPPICTSDGNIIVVARDNCIYKFNTNSQKWSKHTKIGYYYNIYFAALCLSPDEKQLFIFDGNENRVLIIINMETMKTIKVIKNMICTGERPSIISTKTNSNLLHVIGGNQNKTHFSVNINNGQINTIYEFKNVIGKYGLDGGCIAYVANDNKIIYIHSNLQYIYSFNLESNEWKNLNVKIPLTKSVIGCGYVLTNDKKYIIIMSGWDCLSAKLNKIYIYNTNTNHIATHKMLSPIKGYLTATITNNNMIHLFDGNSNGKHYKFSLNSIISVVKQWLENTVKLPELYPLFKAQAVDDLDAVKILTKTDLKDMKITQIGHINKLMRFIQQLNDKSTDEKDEKSNDEIKAGYDPVTNLPMKSIMYKSLFNACNNNEFNIAVCSADMDGMKQLNDTLGHHITDNILKSIADIMANHAKDNKFISVYRMNAGGDEFAMIIKDTNKKLVFKWADDLRKEIDDSTKASISIGIAIRKNKETKNQWFKRAEDALMKAKKKGKNRVVLL
eukprot:317826_1